MNKVLYVSDKVDCVSFLLLETQEENIVMWRSLGELVGLELGIVISKAMLDGW